MGRPRSRRRAPVSLELGALRRAVWGGDRAAASAACVELGRRAARDGWARRFIDDVAEGRLALPAESAVPAVRELALLDPSAAVALLHHHTSPSCAVAAIALGQVGDAFQGEIEALATSPDTPARLAAIAGLAEMAGRGSTRAVDGIAALLHDPQGHVRSAAAAALGRARGREAIERGLFWLTQIVTESEERAVSGAAFAVAGLHPSARKPAQALLLRVAESGRAGRKAVAVAVRDLPRHAAARVGDSCACDSDPEVRALIAPALAAWATAGSAPARRWSARLAADGSPAVRAAAAAACALAPGLADTPCIVHLARDRSPRVRSAVAAALALSPDAAAADALNQLAEDTAAAVRAAAIAALGAGRAQSLVRAACSDREPTVRAAAASALQPGAARDTDLLLALADDRHMSVAQAAAGALSRRLLTLSDEARRRVAVLAHEDATARPSAEGIAHALDRDPAAAPDALLRWPAGQMTPRLLWMIARAARTPEIADLARSAARVVADGDDAAEACSDLSLVFAAVGRADLADLSEWLARCAAAGSLEAIARAAADAPRALPEAVAPLAAAGRRVARALRAGSGSARDRSLARTRVALDIAPALAPDPIHGALVLRTLRAWRAALGEADPGAGPAGVAAALTSARIVAGGPSTVLIDVTNTGTAPALGVTLEVAGAQRAWETSCLAPGERARVPVLLDAMPPGEHRLHGSITFRAAPRSRSVAFEGPVHAVAAPALGAVANPYVVGKPLAPDSAMFFGRTAEIASIERALAGSEGGSVVVVFGSRRTGKTSLLKRLERRLAYRCRPVFVDIQGMLVSGTEAFFDELARLAAAAGRAGEWMLRDGANAASGSGAAAVESVADRLDQRLVLLLDEFDDLEQKVRAGLLSQDVFAQLRHLIQHVGNVDLVLCGTHRLEDLAGEYWSFLLNLATYQRLGSLQESEAEQVVRTPLAEIGIVCEDAAVARAVSLAGRHPYLLQLLGYRIVERCVESGEGAVRTDTVERAADDVVEQGDIHLRYLWERADAAGQPVLEALANDELGLTTEAMRTRIGLEPARLRRAVSILTASESVEESGGRFTLQIGLLSRWLRQGGPR